MKDDYSASLTVERIDDLPLLLAQMERMGIRELLDRHCSVHGKLARAQPGLDRDALAHPFALRRRPSPQPGRAVALRTDHAAAVHRPVVDRLDLADDRSRRCCAPWPTTTTGRFEHALSSRLLRVYDLAAAPVRLDMTTASSEQLVTPDGLFQFGYSKDRAPICAVKIALATLDSLGLPLPRWWFPGNQGDDPLYRR